MRVALDLIYNPECNLVKGCQKTTRSTKIWDVESRKDIKVTSTAPIVTTSKNIQYIWLNKEDCENGSAKTMKLIMLNIEEKAVPFDRECEHNDYAKAEELRAQVEEVAKEGFSEEEWKMVVPVEMDSEDGYDKVTPIFNNSKLETIFNELRNGDINEEDLRVKLKELVDACTTQEEVEKLSIEISEEVARTQEYYKQIKEAEAAKRAEAEKLAKAKEEASLAIDKISFDGGERQ